MKVGHWIPAYRGQVRAEIVGQAMRDCASVNSQSIPYSFWWTDSSDLPRARNEALQTAIDSGLTHLLMQDSDVFAPAGALGALLETCTERDATMVAAVCGLRRGTGQANVLPYQEGDIYEAELVGTGLLLINVEKLKALAYEYHGPFFARTYKDNAQSVADIGEDVFFSILVRNLGGNIWVNGRVETVHVYLDTKTLAYNPRANHVGLATAE